MSKVAIKFWDKQCQEYENNLNLAVAEEGFVYQLLSAGEYDDVSLFYESHFYKDGERIA